MFRKKFKKARPTEPVYYPDGVMVETETDTYYIQRGKRYRTFSPRTRDSWSLKPILGSNASVSHIPLVKSPLGFRDGTLIHNFADGKIYLISGTKRRLIASPDVFERYGWTNQDIVTVSLEEVDLHEKGENLS